MSALNSYATTALDLHEMFNVSCPMSGDMYRRCHDKSLFNSLVSHSHGGLIVLDGLDEYCRHEDIVNDSEEKYPNDPRAMMPVSALCAKLIKRKILRNSLIIVTSRPEEAEEMGTIEFDEYWEIVGFCLVLTSEESFLWKRGNLSGITEFSVILTSEESSLCKRSDPSEMLTALKARHASVIQVSQNNAGPH